MPRFIQWTVLGSTLLCLVSPVAAGLVITMEPSVPSDANSDVLVSFSGTGTVLADGSGSVLDFLNFDANVFDLLPDGANDFSMSVTFEGVDASDLSNYTQIFQTIRLNDQSSGDDILLRDATNTGFAFDVDDTYSAMGSGTLSGLRFGDLIAGDYEASLTSGDGGKFGGVQLSIGAATVPEPSSWLSFSMLMASAAWYARLRKRLR